ncbi:MAG: tetratricopeptide repeat protein [Brevefilum sp.]|nr:tetratricopeptide repeat protein [Brevefilum sp.]
MKPRIFLIILIAALLLAVLLLPNGVRAAVTNNAWSLSFLHEYAQGETINLQDVATPPRHQHAGLLLANQALKQDNPDQAWFYLAPLVSTPDLLILQTQASINFLQGDYVSAINIWKRLGRYSTLYTAASNLNDKEHLDAKILAYRSAYDIRGEPYDRLFTNNSLQKANLLIDEGQSNQAIAILSSLIDEFPHHARLYSGLARAYWLNHQPQQALAAIQQGWDINMDNARYYITAGQYYEELGMDEQALNAYQTALAINPDDRDALQGIERLMEGDE